MKRITKIGTWNVRTLRENGRLRQTVACMKSYGLNILGMSEVRWSGFGEMTTQDGATFFILEDLRVKMRAVKMWVYYWTRRQRKV